MEIKPRVIVSIVLIIVLIIMIKPIVGLFSFPLTDKLQEIKTNAEVETYLEEKYQTEFDVTVKLRSMVGRDVTASPKGEPELAFHVQGPPYRDDFLDVYYKEQIERAVNDDPTLKNDSSLKLKIYFNQNGQFNLENGLPGLSKIPGSPTLFVSSKQQYDEKKSREEALKTLQNVIHFVQSEKMDLKQIKATILLYTSEKEYQYKYVIPESAFESINSVEALRDYES